MCFIQELEKKFQQTAAYRNMKEILTKKNEQIKDIRKRLQRWALINKEYIIQRSSGISALEDKNLKHKNIL